MYNFLHCFVRSHISNGEPSSQLQTLSLSAVDAFGSVHDILHKVDAQHQQLLESIEKLPPGERLQPSVLLLKATSSSTLHCLETALSLLQEVRDGELAMPVVVTKSIPRPKSISEAVIPGSPARGPHLAHRARKETRAGTGQDS